MLADDIAPTRRGTAPVEENEELGAPSEPENSPSAGRRRDGSSPSPSPPSPRRAFIRRQFSTGRSRNPTTTAWPSSPRSAAISLYRAERSTTSPVEVRVVARSVTVDREAHAASETGFGKLMGKACLSGRAGLRFVSLARA